MKRHFRHVASSLVLACVPSVAPAALQSLVPAGPVVHLTSTTHAEDPSLGGTVIADDVRDFFGLNFKGTYQTRVVQRDDNGMLDFYYRVNSYRDESNLGRVLRDFRISDYVGFTTEVSWRPDGLPAPNPGNEWKQAVRFPQPQCPACDGINISFADLVNNVPSGFTSDEESYFAVIRTNATAYRSVAADVYLVNSPTAPFEQYLSNSFQVYAPTPEPAALGVLGLTLLAVADWRRRIG